MPKDSSPDKSPFTDTCVLISTSLELTFARDCTLEATCSDCTKAEQRVCLSLFMEGKLQFILQPGSAASRTDLK